MHRVGWAGVQSAARARLRYRERPLRADGKLRMHQPTQTDIRASAVIG
jgi:hypothetical protein